MQVEKIGWNWIKVEGIKVDERVWKWIIMDESGWNRLKEMKVDKNKWKLIKVD